MEVLIDRQFRATVWRDRGGRVFFTLRNVNGLSVDRAAARCENDFLHARGDERLDESKRRDDVQLCVGGRISDRDADVDLGRMMIEDVEAPPAQRLGGFWGAKGPPATPSSAVGQLTPTPAQTFGGPHGNSAVGGCD